MHTQMCLVPQQTKHHRGCQGSCVTRQDESPDLPPFPFLQVLPPVSFCHHLLHKRYVRVHTHSHKNPVLHSSVSEGSPWVNLPQESWLLTAELLDYFKSLFPVLLLSLLPPAALPLGATDHASRSTPKPLLHNPV